MIVLDTPPVLATADAGIVASLTDGVLLVVRAGATDRNAAAASLPASRQRRRARGRDRAERSRRPGREGRRLLLSLRLRGGGAVGRRRRRMTQRSPGTWSRPAEAAVAAPASGAVDCGGTRRSRWPLGNHGGRLHQHVVFHRAPGTARERSRGHAADEHRDRRPRRPRQEHGHRPAAGRHPLAARGQARAGAGPVRAQLEAVRVRLPARRAQGRAGPGHHHRRGPGVLQERRPAVPDPRRARPHRVPEEHDHRRGPRRGRAAGHRRRRGRPGELPAPRLHGVDARRPRSSPSW